MIDNITCQSCKHPNFESEFYKVYCKINQTKI